MIDILQIVSQEDLPPIKTPSFDADDGLIKRVFDNKVNLRKLPKDLYEFTFLALSTQLSRFFGLPTDFEPKTVRHRLATSAKKNLSLFAGAKTFQNVLELSLAVFDANGEVRAFPEFAAIARQINERYNLAWLSTEQQAGARQSLAMEDWTSIEEDKEIFPLLKYSTVGDRRVRPEHAEIDQVIKPVDDPFWDTWFPPNGWNCRCQVLKIREGTPDPVTYDKNDDPVFSTNVGKNGIIFPDKHPYFDIPDEFKSAKNNNFGFTMPSDKDIRDFQ